MKKIHFSCSGKKIVDNIENEFWYKFNRVTQEGEAALISKG